MLLEVIRKGRERRRLPSDTVQVEHLYHRPPDSGLWL